MSDSFLYPLDVTGSALSNRVRGEFQTLSPPTQSDNFQFLIPKSGPFFRDSVKLIHVPTGRTLERGVDWDPGHYFHSASYETESVKGGIYQSILFLDRTLTGPIELVEYQVLGGHWSLDENKILEILSNKLQDPRTLTYEQVSDKPDVFPPIDHQHPGNDLTGMREAVSSIYEVAAAIRERTDFVGNLPIFRPDDYYTAKEIDSLLVRAAGIPAEVLSGDHRLVAEVVDFGRDPFNARINRLDIQVAADNRVIITGSDGITREFSTKEMVLQIDVDPYIENVAGMLVRMSVDVTYNQYNEPIETLNLVAQYVGTHSFSGKLNNPEYDEDEYPTSSSTSMVVGFVDFLKDEPTLITYQNKATHTTKYTKTVTFTESEVNDPDGLVIELPVDFAHRAVSKVTGVSINSSDGTRLFYLNSRHLHRDLLWNTLVLTLPPLDLSMLLGAKTVTVSVEVETKTLR